LSTAPFETLKASWEQQWLPLLKSCPSALVGVATILRIPHYNNDEEEPDYWAYWGEALHEYSRKVHQQLRPQYEHAIPCLTSWFAQPPKPNTVGCPDIPEAILNDFIQRHQRQWQLWQLWLENVKRHSEDSTRLFQRLIFSQDDTGTWGLNVLEAEALKARIQALGLNDTQAYVQTGADELLTTQMAWLMTYHVTQAPTHQATLSTSPFTLQCVASEPSTLGSLSRYDGITCEEVITRQANACGIRIHWVTPAMVQHENPLLIVHTPSPERQGDHCGDYFEDPLNGKPPPNTSQGIAIIEGLFNKTSSTVVQGGVWLADIAYSNGGDPALARLLLPSPPPSLKGYSAWNTASNTVGCLLAWWTLTMCVAHFSVPLGDNTKISTTETPLPQHQTQLLSTRLLEDLIFQALVRPKLRPIYPIHDTESWQNATEALRDTMAPYTEKLCETMLTPFLGHTQAQPAFSLPCGRWFEVACVWQSLLRR
jgi:hypothetical protein